MVGFAPGGVVVVWISGPGKQTEIGRYQGHKTVIPQSEIDKMDSNVAAIFKEEYWQSIIHNNRKRLNEDDEINPEHIDLKKQLDNNPIPFGLWDKYTTKYNLNLIFDLPEGASLLKDSKVNMFFYNGEQEQLLSKDFPLSSFNNRSIPRSFVFDFVDPFGKSYGATANINQKSAFEAFEKVSGNAPEKISMSFVIKVNLAYSSFSIKLVGSNGNEEFIETEGLKVF